MNALPALLAPAASAWIGAVAPSPSPTDVLRPDLSPYDVTPGLIGFLTAFFLAVAGVGLWFGMNRKLRRIEYSRRAAEREAAEAGPDDGSTPAGVSGPSSPDAAAVSTAPSTPAPGAPADTPTAPGAAQRPADDSRG